MKRIAIYPPGMDWAFGQIYRAVKKYSRHDISLFDMTADTSVLFDFDLIHVPCLIHHVKLLKQQPELAGKLCVSIHGKAELYNYDPIGDKKRVTSKEEVESGILPPETITYINRLRQVACISDELVELVRKNTTAKVYRLTFGVDPDIFYSDIITHDKLTVVCPMARSYMETMKTVHGYNVKRFHLILQLEKMLPEIDFVFLDKLVTIDEIASFYKKGDILISLSHSEGSSGGFMEAGAMGLLPFTTMTGTVPELLQHDVNSILIKEQSEQQMIKDSVKLLSYLNLDRAKLLHLRQQAQKTIFTRTWNKVIDSWDTYFDTLLDSKVFVEIGSNCYDTLVPKASSNWTGVIVEPIKEYFDKVERVPGVSYEQVAIGTENKVLDFFYLSGETIKKLNASGAHNLGPRSTRIRNHQYSSNKWWISPSYYQ